MSEMKDNLKDEDRIESIRKNCKDPVVMAMYLLQDNATMVSCNDALYIYNGKCYDFISDKDLDRMYLNFCIEYGITNAFKNVNMVLRALIVYPGVARIEKMNDYPNLMCLNNGILNIHTKEFIPHSPTYYFDSAINVDYDPNATSAPNFVAFLNHTFNGEQDTIANIIRLGGYLLDTSNAAEAMFLFNGNGGSGKSTLINTFSMFFHQSMDEKNQVTSLTLEQLASGTFDKICLLNSRFNQCAETKKGHIESEEIKKIVSGDVISISRKFKEPVNFRPKLKIIVACNGLPTFTDTSDGTYRRIVIIEFTNQYKRPSEYAKIKNPELKNIYVMDTDLNKKIMAEKSAILNLFIGGLIDLKNSKYEFVASASSEASMEVFRRESDSCREYLETTYEIDSSGEITLKDIYEGFRFWYRQNVQDYGGIKFRSSELAKRVKETFGLASTGRKAYYNNDTKSYERLSFYPLRLINPPITEEEHVDKQIEAFLNK
jgi:putative DNA primase/helicase